MIRTFCVTLLYFVTQFVFAFDSSPSVFYPLPTESQGRAFAAKQLFLSSSGGLWIHDVRGKVLFFDGQTVSPKWGSALPYPATKLVVHDDRFWSFSDNLVYQSTSHSEREVEFSLPPGSEIESMGSSEGYLWLNDGAHFHTYRIADGEFSTYSLMELYRYNQSTSLAINDALRVKDRWVLATEVGVFVSQEEGFRHVPRSKNNSIDKLYYSKSRRELVLGSERGAVVYDINNTSKPKFIIPAPDVTSVAETTQAYWIGTSRGLYVYSFISGKMAKYSGEKDAGYTLSGRKILSIVNDTRGGMWIATNKGIHYFSLFGDKFERIPSQDLSSEHSHIKMNDLVALNNKQGYWVIQDSGLYRLLLRSDRRKEQFYAGRVHNLLEHKGTLWLATNHGIVAMDAKNGRKLSNQTLTTAFKGQRITHLSLDSKGNLWIANSENIWCFSFSTNQLKLVAENWMQSSSASGSLKKMLLTSGDELILGTENGVYILKQGLLKFVSQSAKYGSVHSMVEDETHRIWVASNYGVNVLNLNTMTFNPIAMIDEHISPQCLVDNETGVWLTSTAGLTHYDAVGSMIAHYGQPFGVINNEFKNGFCLLDANDPNSLLLGSWHSLIKVQSQDLMVSPVPEASVLFSQVLVNQEMVAFGSIDGAKIVAPYGESISVQIGTMPLISGTSLEYRLNNESQWTQLEGYQIAMEGLAPGHYKLYVRAVVNGMKRGTARNLSFEVTEPWYLSSIALVSYVAAGFTILFGSVYWRSRLVASANRKLKAQVALKTNQLRHQSRILLSNNHQLRKQLQVRRLIFSQAVQSFKDRLRKAEQAIDGESNRSQAHIVDQISSELELLLNVRESQKQDSPAYNLSMIFNSTLGGWREELAKAGIAVEWRESGDNDAYVILNYFNLDILFNLLFDGIVNRCSRYQTVEVNLISNDDNVQLSFIDYGNRIDTSQEGHWGEVEKLVDISGGHLVLDLCEDKNSVFLSWQRSHDFNEHSLVEVERITLNDPTSGVVDSFIERLEMLVLENYTDPDFSTSTAAKMLFVSERSLQRRFKGATQRTFSDYLSEVRLDNACRHLLAGAKVADVAFDCGFNDPSYFSQRFKHRFGVSPTQFVEQNFNEEAF
ncbi:helix-turn-helix domain-containing protein [Vibrio panuliri]|uniref:helix-turn-helix domain-containing protein n=1 Tax=Vibrio panuliri TaxID=1381081 RepID=UPI0009FAF63D|nr:helix-turn-helix domain-containing protein [Vibrio panuliri]KAB1454976.1 helix-turn-helix domain-containing protein [Vibrio panuliri]